MQNKSANLWGVFEDPIVEDAISLETAQSVRNYSSKRSSSDNPSQINVNDDFVVLAKQQTERSHDIFVNNFEVEEEQVSQWQLDALCSETDPDAFFPERGGSTKDAKRICSLCNVREECLEFALENNEHIGIWGGKSERERRAIQQKRKHDIKHKTNHDINSIAKTATAKETESSQIQETQIRKIAAVG